MSFVVSSGLESLWETLPGESWEGIVHCGEKAVLAK